MSGILVIREMDRMRKRIGIVNFISAVVIEKIHIMKNFHKAILKVLMRQMRLLG